MNNEEIHKEHFMRNDFESMTHYEPYKYHHKNQRNKCLSSFLELLVGIGFSNLGIGFYFDFGQNS